jgi:hypothetical protein
LPSPVTVKLKIKPYLKKYLIGKSINKEEPLLFDRKDEFGDIIFSCLTNHDQQKFLSINDKEFVYAYFNQRWPRGEWCEIQLPYNRNFNVLYKNYLSDHNNRIIVDEITSRFYLELNKYLVFNIDKGVHRKVILHHFLGLYNITEDDVNFDSIYRQSSRMLECKTRKFYYLFRHINAQFVL